MKKVPELSSKILFKAYVAGACARHRLAHGVKFVSDRKAEGFTHYGAAEEAGVKAAFALLWKHATRKVKV